MTTEITCLVLSLSRGETPEICKTKHDPEKINNWGDIYTQNYPIYILHFLTFTNLLLFPMALSPQLLLSCGIWTSKKQNKGKVESLRQHRPYLKLLWVGNLVVYSNLVICTSWTWGFFWLNLVLYFHIKGCNKTVWIIWVPWFSTTVHECQVSLQTEHTGYMEEFIWVKVKLFSPILKNHFSNFINKIHH